jgi:dUTP pyrophosphatase
MSEAPLYKLKIYLDPNLVDSETRVKYKEQITKRQEEVNHYKTISKDWDLSNRDEGVCPHIDAGFDLFTPSNNILGPRVMGQKVSMGVKCSMTFNGMPVGYYLYPRSSTGAKTPLRLSNSVGIIDSGYRGYIIALFDNIKEMGDRENIDRENEESDYVINKDDRVVQICSPNITYPIYPELVNSEEELGSTLRGEGGFGSSGK